MAIRVKMVGGDEYVAEKVEEREDKLFIGDPYNVEVQRSAVASMRNEDQTEMHGFGEPDVAQSEQHDETGAHDPAQE